MNGNLEMKKNGLLAESFAADAGPILKTLH
jgi:hypothetical protein